MSDARPGSILGHILNHHPRPHAFTLNPTPALTRTAARTNSGPGIFLRKMHRRKVDNMGVAAAIRLRV
jgi:hypothetical protein